MEEETISSGFNSDRDPVALAQIQELSKRVMTLENENRKLKMMHEQEVANYKEVIKMNEEKGIAENKKNTMLDTLISNITSEAEEKRKREISSIRAKYDLLMSESKANHQSELEKLTNEIFILKSELEKKTTSLSEISLSFTEKLNSIKNKNKLLQREVEFLQQSKIDTEKAVNQFKEERDYYIQANKQMQDENTSKITGLVTEYERQLSTNNANLGVKIKEFQSELQRKDEIYRREVQNLRNQHDEKFKKIEFEVEQKDRVIKELNETIKERTVQIRKTKLSNYELKEKVASLKKQICLLEPLDGSSLDIFEHRSNRLSKKTVETPFEHDSPILFHRDNEEFSLAAEPPRKKVENINLESIGNTPHKMTVDNDESQIRPTHCKTRRSRIKITQSIAKREHLESENPFFIQEKINVLEHRVNHIENSSLTRDNLAESSVLLEDEDELAQVEVEVTDLLDKIEQKQAALKRNYPRNSATEKYYNCYSSSKENHKNKNERILPLKQLRLN